MIFAKNEKERETLIQTIGIYSQDLGMEFRIEKYAMFNNGKKWRKENYKYLGKLQADIIKQTGEEKINKKGIFCSRNLIKGINN